MDDIVAVLPPLLQSLEALSFVARHLNPPDFDRVMQAAGYAGSSAAVGTGAHYLSGPRNFPASGSRLRPQATRRWPRSAACARCTTATATRLRDSRRSATPRARRRPSIPSPRAAAGEPFFWSPRARRRAPLAVAPPPATTPG